MYYKKVGFEHYELFPELVTFLYYAGRMVREGKIEPFELTEEEIEAFKAFPKPLIDTIAKFEKELLDVLKKGFAWGGI